MFRKSLLSILMVMIMGFTFVGCSTEVKEPEAPESETTADAGEDKIVIGFSQCIMDSPFYVALVEAAEKAAEDAGIEFFYLDAQNDIQKQNNDISDMISKGIDVLILNPVDADGVKPSLEALAKAGIPVVTVDRPVNDPSVVTLVGRDNEAMGAVVGAKMVELLGGKGKATGKILELQGDAGGNVMEARRDGFHSVVDLEPGITVVQSPYCDYVRSNAIKATQDILQANPDIIAIYGHNDDMALGGLQVMEQNDMKDIIITGVDGLMEAVEGITTGRYNATTINDPGYLGTVTIETAIKVAKGETVESFIDAGTGIIDETNADEYLDENVVFAEVH
jgi:ribose transport system substrate-binding protein